MSERMNMDKKKVAQLGALMSDLNAGVFAFATEGETGKSLVQRTKEIRASLDAIEFLIARLVLDRI
jgi:hypothetical protein